MTLRMTIAEMNALLDEVFPQVKGQFTIEESEPERLRVRMHIGEAHLRPGGTVSGPARFAVADVAIYLLTLSRIGPVPLAVTTNCSIDFMRKPGPADLVAEARLLKLGRSLSVGDVLVYSDGVEKPVARANLTYSIPPAR